MKNDLKKKFLDILFEPEEEDIVEESPMSEVNRTKVSHEKKTNEEVKVSKAPKANDILYGDGAKEANKAFINYKESTRQTIPETPKYVKEEKVADLSETYELKRHISPIFGETEEKVTGRKEEVIKKPVAPMPSMNKGDYTNVVLSPIFGYDSASADKARTDFVKNKRKDSAILRETVKPAGKTAKVEELYDEPISLFEEPFDIEDKDERKDEPFTSEIKVIDVEGEPIEEVKEEDDEEDENIRSFEVNGLDDLDMYSEKKETVQYVSPKEEIKDYSSANAKSFIDDLLGDKD